MLVGWIGTDTVRGGKGPDQCLNTQDFSPGDLVVGGPGRDAHNTDAGDLVRASEVAAVCGPD